MTTTTIDSPLGDDFNFDDDLDNLVLDDSAAPLTEEPEAKRDLSFFRKIPVTVTLEVASAEVQLGDLMKAGQGTVIDLEKAAGEPLDVCVNGTLLAQGEVVVVNGNFGVRITNVVNDTMLSDMTS